jgi:hypothetical protein
MSTMPTPNSNAFCLTMPEGWSVVDIGRLLDGSLLNAVKASLGDAVTPADLVGVERRLSALRRQVDAENLMLLALRAQAEGEVLQVLTVACPSPDFACETQGLNRQNSQPCGAAGPAQVIQLSSGAEAMVYGDAPHVTDDRETQWAKIQLVTRIPETEMTVILTALSSDYRGLGALIEEVTALVQSISRNTTAKEVTEIAFS